MSAGLPISRPYNLNRLGQVGDIVPVHVSDEERAALAQFAGVPRIDAFSSQVTLKKLSSDRFQLDFTLLADLCQTCVVTLVDVPAHIERRFGRELHFNPALHRATDRAGLEEIPLDDDAPEEIGSLHFDLAVPLVEEFVLAIDPYPKAPGVEFDPPGEASEGPRKPVCGA